MAATLECIGIPSGPPETVTDWLAKLAASTRELHRTVDISHSLWRDYSGAAVAIQVRKGKVECITPWFTSPDGPTKWLVESSAPSIDPDCLDCSGADLDVLDDSGEVRTRAAVQWLFFRPYKDWLGSKRRYRIEIAAFAERCDVFGTEAEFENAVEEAGAGVRLAPNGFIPVGLFGKGEGGMRARARAIFAGTITHSVRRENTLTGEKFVQIRLATLPGEIDVVHPSAPEWRPKPGMMALVTAWLVGRPVDSPPPTKSLLRKLFRR